MEGVTVARVIASRHPDFAVGDHVAAYLGWVSHAISDGTGLVKLDERFAPPRPPLGDLVMPALTATAGLREIRTQKEREPIGVAAGGGPPRSTCRPNRHHHGGRVGVCAAGASKRPSPSDQS